MIKTTIFTKYDVAKDVKVSKLADGRYRGRLQISYDTITRKYQYKSFYGPNKTDVKHKIVEFIESQIDRQTEKSNYDELLTTNIEKWLKFDKYGNLKGTSYDRLEQVYKNQIAPYIGDLKTSEITPIDCKKILQKNLEKGYSYSTLLKIYRLLNEFFNNLEDEGKVETSPMRKIKPYRKEFVKEQQANVREARDKAVKKKEKGQTLTVEEESLAFSKLRMQDKEEIRFLQDDEIERIKDVIQNGYMLSWTTKTGKNVQNGPYFLTQPEYFMFILNTGLRCGEATALKYSDVDFDDKTIAIRRNFTAIRKRDSEGNALVGKKMVEGTPKSEGSADIVPINDTAILILKEMLKKEPDGYTGYIVHNSNYSHLGETALRKRFANLLRRADVEECGIHSLRHTFASKLYELTNGDSKLVSSMIRHSSVSFTEEIYIHLTQKYKRKVIVDFNI